MSVFMTMRAEGDREKLIAVAKESQQVFHQVRERAQGLGALHHQFWASGNTIMVVDEWTDAESFHKFFAASPEIGKIMAESGFTSQPEITAWEKLELGDEF